jgi:hypothetical protein
MLIADRDVPHGPLPERARTTGEAVAEEASSFRLSTAKAAPRGQAPA